MSVGEECQIGTSSRSGKEQFATAKVAEHVKEKARRDETHQEWIDDHTATGSLAEIRDALDDHHHPRS